MKSVTNVLLLGCLTTLGACALTTDRSYLAEMERDDESFFKPREDFPVVPGDDGQDWRGEEEMRQRTPASISERFKEKQRSSLEKQLSRLESSQSEGAFAHYQQHRARLGSTSERIYFLQLPNRQEREDYLASRGLLAASNPLPAKLSFGVPQEELLLEMTKEEVISSWGKPDRVDIAGKPSYENERWIYQRDGAVKYVYFEGGRVGGWTSDSRSPAGGQNPFR
jgi:hypothetical protein